MTATTYLKDSSDYKETKKKTTLYKAQEGPQDIELEVKKILNRKVNVFSST